MITLTQREEEAKDNLITLDAEYCDKHNIRSGRDYEKDIEGYRAEVKEWAKNYRINQNVVDALEDDNYHTLVEALYTQKLILK